MAEQSVGATTMHLSRSLYSPPGLNATLARVWTHFDCRLSEQDLVGNQVPWLGKGSAACSPAEIATPE